tara:strand:- start:278 stop:541 length:264 start_codon:yes stop_codon:yes gene_type:complete
VRVVFYLDLFVVVVVVVVLSGPFFKLRFLKGKDITREEISTCALALSLSSSSAFEREKKRRRVPTTTRDVPPSAFFASVRFSTKTFF